MYCSFCGQKVYDEENFCPNCGHKIDKSRVISENKETNIIKKDAQVVDIDSFLSEISQETNNVVKAEENNNVVCQDTVSNYSNESVISPPTHTSTVDQTQDYSVHMGNETRATNNYRVSKFFMIFGAIVAFLFGVRDFALLGGVVSAIIGVISPIWTIPMICHLFNCAKNSEKPSIAFKICSLIFVSGVGGIFMLCNK